MDEKTLKELLSIAVRAPSGDNSQPWRFKIIDGGVRVFVIPDLDNEYLNVDWMGSYIAVGALIKNVKIASSNFGYEANVDYFPKDENKKIVADIEFVPTETRRHILHASIFDRATNRKPYVENKKLSSEALEKYLDIAKQNNLSVSFLSEKSTMEEVARAASTMEEVAFQVKELHDAFFKNITWTKKEEREKKTGLFIKTLEVPLPIEWFFRLLRKWSFISFLNKKGFSGKIAEGNAKTYAKASAFGLITIPSGSSISAVKAGEALQEIWLDLTRNDMSLQLVTGITFLNFGIQKYNSPKLSPELIKKTKEAFGVVERAFSVNEGLPVLLFRVGYAPKPSASTSRFEVEDLIIKTDDLDNHGVN